MPLLLLTVVRWLSTKTLEITLVLICGIGIYALYLFLGDSIKLERQRVEQLGQAEARAQEAYAQLDDLHGRLIETGDQLDKALSRFKQARESLQDLEGFLSKIEYLFLPDSEKRRIDTRLASSRKYLGTSEENVSNLRSQQAALRIERAGLSEEANVLEEKIRDLESNSSEVIRYIDNSWRTLRPYLPYTLAAIFFGPLLLKATCYYLVAPVLCLARPIRFSKVGLPPPSISSVGVSIPLSLDEGELAWIKESYLQASDECLGRKTRFVLDWKIPFTCVAAGLTELVEFAASKEETGSITVSTQEQADIELGLLCLEEGSSLILRPSHIVGIVSESGRRLRIRRRWNFWHAQAWIALQFRYFEFQGPARIVVAGIRGVRAEALAGVTNKGRRTNQDSTIGFTPDLAFGAARAETFWAYLRGFNPLFDDVFRGRGVFLCQEISKGNERGAKRFWAGLRDAVLKVIGI